MNAVARFWHGLTLKPQGFTMVIAAFLPVFAIIAMFPVLPLLIEHFHADPAARIKVPAMVTAPGYAIALLAPFAGMIVDRFGRRPLLLGCTLFYGIVGAAPLLLNDLDAIFASRLALGVCEAGILTIVNTLIADYWDDSGRRNWLMAQGILGPALQPGVFFLVAWATTARWNGVFLVYLVAFPIFLAMLAFLFEPARPGPAADDPARTAGPFPMREALTVGALTLFVAILYYVFIVNGGLVWQENGVADPLAISKLTAIPALFVVAGSVLFRIVSRYSNTVQIATLLGLLGIGLGGMGLTHSRPLMQLFLVIQQTGAGMSVPALIAWSQTKFGFAHRGRGMGIWTSAFFLGQAISPVIIGTVAGNAGSMHGAFAIAGLVGLVAAAAGFALATRAPLRSVPA